MNEHSIWGFCSTFVSLVGGCTFFDCLGIQIDTSTIIRKVQQQAEVRLQFFKISKGQPGLIIISLQRPWGLHTKSHHHNSTTKPHHQPQIVNRNQKTPFYYSRPPLRPSFSDEDWIPLAGCGQFLNFIFVKCVKMLGANRNKHKLN